MAKQGVTRKLTAILCADVAGYSRLTGADEEGTHKALSTQLDLMAEVIGRHGGRVVHYAGDAVLADFGSVVSAVACAADVQNQFASRNADSEDDPGLQFRIGINLGEVIVDRDDIYGDGVNVAARLESLADPGGICVSASVFDQVKGKLDLGFEDMGPQKMKNIAEPVRAYAVRAGKVVGSAAASPSPHEKPTVAVLPFDNMSGDADQEYFANGITEDIITALSRNRWLSVIARNSTFAYKGKSPDVRKVADELGATYVVEGSVRKAGNRLRISAQLIDAGTGSHLWAERYDRELEDIFAVQDEITGTIAATIEPALAAIESKRAGKKLTENLGAWDCYHLGLSHLYKFSKSDNAEAQRLLRRAIELDPDFSSAYSRLSYAIVMSAIYFDVEPTPELLDDALRTAKKAAALDDQDALAHFAVGRAHLARSEYDLSIAELETAINLNPCLAQAHCGLGDALAYSGRAQESVSHFAEAIRLSPHDPYRWGFLMYRSLAHLFMGDYEAAAEWAGKAVRVPNSWYWANAHLVAALGHLGRREETQAAAKELLRRKPEFSCRFARKHLFYIKDPAQKEHYLEGLRKAGIPEAAGAPTTADADMVVPPPLPDVPSIAVLPFANVSGDPEQEYFSDGVADDLITALSNVRSFFVIDRSSSFTFKGKTVTVKEVGNALGVRYVVEGSVRKAGNKVRVSAQLVEAATGAHVWAGRYDGALDDIFDLQDRIAASVVGAIEPQLQRAEFERIRLKRPDSFDAYDLTLAGLAHMNMLNPKDTDAALTLFRRAIEADPTYARAYVCASWCYRRRVQLMGMVLSDAERAEAVRLARAALKADSTDPYVLWQAGVTAALVEGDFEEGAALIDRSLAINANSNRAWLSSAMRRCYSGNPETAIEYAEKAMRLSPLDVSMWVAYGCLATAYMQLGDYEAAVEWARKSVRMHRDHLPAHLVLVASLAQLGRQSDAKAAAGELLALDSDLTIASIKKRFPIAGYRNLEGFLGGLAKAGLPA